MTNACPVIIRGFVPLSATKTPVLTFTFERKTLTANTWRSSDGLSDQNAPDSLYAEKAINPSQLSNLVVGTTPDPVKGYPFQAQWNQRLSRTSVTLDNNGSVASSQRWIIRAYSVYSEAAPVNPAGASSSTPNPATDKQFRVMGMAHPTDITTINPFGEYTERNRPPPGASFDTYALTSDTLASGNQFAFPISIYFGPNGGIPHLAVDYSANVGNVINTTEYGIIDDSADKFLTIDKQLGVPAHSFYGISRKDADAIRDYVKMSGLEWPQLKVIVQKEDIDSDDTYHLGPNRQVNHGRVNLALSKAYLSAASDALKLALTPDQIYDRGIVNTKYCHIATQMDNVTPLAPPVNGKYVNISAPIAQVGDWYTGNNPLVQQFQNAPDKLLSRGYFFYGGVTLNLVNRADINRTTGILLKGKQALFTIKTTVAFPSITGPHLHFEVRALNRIDLTGTLPNGDGVIRPNGEQNPHQWVFYGFNAFKQ